MENNTSSDNINNYRPKDDLVNINNAKEIKPNRLLYDEISSNRSNKKIDSNREMKESFYIYKYSLDITNEELNLLNQDNNFSYFLKEFNNIFHSKVKINIIDSYNKKIKNIENKKGNIPNYYYFYLLLKKKFSLLKKLFDEIFPFILKNCPELNTNDIFIKLYTEIINIINSSKQLMITLHKHIESYNNKNNIDSINGNSYNNNELNKIIIENNKTISKIQSEKNNLLKKIDNDKNLYELKINSLEKENQNLTNKLLNKYNFDKIKSYTIMNSKKNLLNIDSSYNFKSITPKAIRDKQNFEKNRSPHKLKKHEKALSNENILILHTENNKDNNQESIKNSQLSLTALKEFINELYISKENYNKKCDQMRLPKETLEGYMYTYLYKKFGLKNLVISWAKNIIQGIKLYSKKDINVFMFGKILKNEQEEDARFILEKIQKNVEDLLIFNLKRQNPLIPEYKIKKILENKKNSELYEEEWKGILFFLYEKKEAEEIQKKIENFINHENQIKQNEIINEYKNTRLSKGINYNNNLTNNISINNTNLNNSKNNDNSFNMTNINFFNNKLNTLTFNKNISSPINKKFLNNKLTRSEKYKMLFIKNDKNIKYDEFIKIVSRCHIRFRDRRLKIFVQLFNNVDTDKDGIINEEEFSELIKGSNIFKKEEIESYIYYYLEKIDPFDFQKITFSQCVTFFSQEFINDNWKNISILEKICINQNDKNENKNNNNKICINEIEKKNKSIK